METRIKSWCLSELESPEDWIDRSLRQLSQWVAFTWKSVTMREGMTYPRPIPRAFPAIAKALANALANAISFFRHHKFAKRPPKVDTKTHENWEISWPVNKSQYRLLWMAQFLITHPTIEVTSPIITVNIFSYMFQKMISRYDFTVCIYKLYLMLGVWGFRPWMQQVTLRQYRW